jgi:hypothetical protein
LDRAWKTNEEVKEFHEKLNQHLQIQKREREELSFRTEFAAENQKKVLMLVTDSPSKIYLPNLPNDSNTNQIHSKAICFRWTGYVNPAWTDANEKINLLVEPAQWYDHTGNYGISLLDQILEEELKGIKPENYPQVLINQTDRGPEYNNYWYLQYLGLLLLKGIFQGALYGRLPAGHRCARAYFS